MTELDPIEESFKGAMKVAATSAIQLGAVSLRYIHQLVEKTRAANEQSAREALTRFHSERTIAEHSLVPIREHGWWEQATPERVSAALSTSYAWRDHSEVAATSFDDIKRELHERYGIEIEGDELDSATVHTQLENFTQQRDIEEAERQKHAAAEEHANAQLALTEADLLDERAAEFEARANLEVNPEASSNLQGEAAQLRSKSSHALTESARSYDSAEGRSARAAVLEKSGLDPELVAMRNRANLSYAHPPQAATIRTGAQQKRRSSSTSAAPSKKARIER